MPLGVTLTWTPDNPNKKLLTEEVTLTKIYFKLKLSDQIFTTINVIDLECFPCRQSNVRTKPIITDIQILVGINPMGYITP